MWVSKAYDYTSEKHRDWDYRFDMDGSMLGNTIC